MMLRPPLERLAPRTKSTWPPTPLKGLRSRLSAATWPLRSTARQEFMENHVVVLGDDERVVGVVHREDLDGAVVIEPVVEAPGAHGKGDHDLAGVQALAAAGDHALFRQVHDAVGDHLRMDAQVVFVVQEAQGGVGNGPDAQLEAVAVLDHTGDVLADGFFDIADGRGLHLDDLAVVRHEIIDLN